MKVAIISCYSLDATMPLTKYEADENVDVHLFAPMPRENQNVFVLDFTKDPQPHGFIRQDIAEKRMGKSLCQYLSKVKTRFFVQPGDGKKDFPFTIYYAWKFSRTIIKGKYDVVHLIHTSGFFSFLLLRFLKGQPLIQTLHEVTSHFGDTYSYNIRIMRRLVEKRIPIIFHSEVSKERFIKFRSSISNETFPENLLIMVRFSLHETYLHFLPAQDGNITSTAKPGVPVVLHVGRIVPYKGIDILVDAIRILQKKQPVHLIVAGGGEPYFNFDGVDSYDFLNYSVSNEEMIELVKNCTLVVCPYRSASQSGIPMTVFPFNKPIIASNTGGFAEIIAPDKTGLLVDTIDAPSFADAIERLLANKELQEKIVENVKTSFSQGEFSWTNIARKTINFYKTHYPQKA